MKNIYEFFGEDYCGKVECQLKTPGCDQAFQSDYIEMEALTFNINVKTTE